MPERDQSRSGSTITPLIDAGRPMALDRGRPDEAVRARLEALDEARLVAPASVRDPAMAQCCLAALWLRHDFLDEAHRLAQQVETAEGSYWHGILHRREGDYPNAKYWFRRVGPHPIQGALAAAARQLAAADSSPETAFLRSRSDWDAFGFVDLCEAVVRGGSQAAQLCRAIQEREWQLLFDRCFKAAAA